MKISIIETRTVPTINIMYDSKDIYFHSKYDPLREAKSWAMQSTKNINLENTNEIIIFGVGAGYHIKEFAKLNPNTSIKVIEFNEDVFRWFMKSSFVDSFKNIDQTIHFAYFKDIQQEERNRLFADTSTGNLLIHKSVLDTLPKEHIQLKNILEDIQFKKKTITDQIDRMNINFQKNLSLNDSGIKELKNIYEDKPMLLISAGPSLDKQMTLLQEIRKNRNIIICAVGTALKPLIKNGILPNFFCITDPNRATFEQLTELQLNNTRLYYLSTAYHDTVKLHSGPRSILWQKGFDKAESKAKILGEPCIETGGSVATSLLSLMTHLSRGPIALVGQDLAYTNGFSHTTFSDAQKKLVKNKTRITTLNYYQTGQIATSKNLSVYRKWFEDFAKNNTELSLYNCTEGGAHIKNWKHINLKSFYDKIK